MKIQILVDNPGSWFLPYAEKLAKELKKGGHKSKLVYKHKDVIEGDILCLIGCVRIFKDLYKNTHNLVVHESDLPKGKGWSPLTWQVLEGKKKIPITLFEATVGVDSGDIYLQDFIILEGHELLNEIKHQQGLKTNQLIHKFIDNYNSIRPRRQSGLETFYKRRKPEDSEVDIYKPI
ncbi:formyltransferase family protein, partial [Bacteroidota bacterium]